MYLEENQNVERIPIHIKQRLAHEKVRPKYVAFFTLGALLVSKEIINLR